MRDHVRAAIQAAYPGHLHGVRDRSRLDREVPEREILALVADVAAQAVGDVTVEPAHEYDVCYRVRVAHPGRETWSHLTFLLVSRLARFYTLFWNALAPGAGHACAAFCEEPPPALREFTTWLHATLGARGFSHVDPSELQEEVPFVDPGATMVKERRVTVFNCLFSEV